MTTPMRKNQCFLIKATENLFNKAICKETKVTVTFRRSKPHDVLMGKVASLNTTGTSRSVTRGDEGGKRPL